MNGYSLSLQLHHPSEKSGGLKTFPDHDEDHQPFPTLERALSVIDTHAGKKIVYKHTSTIILSLLSVQYYTVSKTLRSFQFRFQYRNKMGYGKHGRNQGKSQRI